MTVWCVFPSDCTWIIVDEKCLCSNVDTNIFCPSQEDEFLIWKHFPDDPIMHEVSTLEREVDQVVLGLFRFWWNKLSRI